MVSTKHIKYSIDYASFTITILLVISAMQVSAVHKRQGRGEQQCMRKCKRILMLAYRRVYTLIHQLSMGASAFGSSRTLSSCSYICTAATTGPVTLPAA